MEIEKTRAFYKSIKATDLCNCYYCKYYTYGIKNAYPTLAKYLDSLGVDIEKPFETRPLDIDDGTGYIENFKVQYIVLGEPDDFEKSTVGSVNVKVASSHPSTNIKEPHFVIEVYPLGLRMHIKFMK